MFSLIALLFIGIVLQSQLCSAITVDYTKISGNTPLDKLPDFSFCGYHASEIAIPIPKNNTITLSTSSGDQTSKIQSALNSVASGGGGVVGLHSGTYTISSLLTIPSGVLLRGEGVNKTYFQVPNASQNWIQLGETATGSAKTLQTTSITDNYVPVGATQVFVESAAGFSVGQTIYIKRLVTQAWITAQGMAYLNEDGNHWIEPRTITGISGNTINFDVPLTDSIYNAAPFSMKGNITSYTAPKASKEVGLEKISIHPTPSCSGAALGNITCGSAPIAFAPWTSDSWISNLDLAGFMGSITLSTNTLRLTIANVAMHHTAPANKSAGYPSDISVLGTQALIVNCSVWGAADTKTYPVTTMTMTPGPNAVVNFTAEQPVHEIEPHERWAHGFLVDASKAPTYFINRADAGSGHGWTINSGVAWNVDWPSVTVNVSSPPNGTNYAIGCAAPANIKYENGTYEYPGQSVDPPSLFAAQLKARGF